MLSCAIKEDVLLCVVTSLACKSCDIEIRNVTSWFQSHNFATCNFRTRIMVCPLLRPGNWEKALAIYFGVFLDGNEENT